MKSFSAFLLLLLASLSTQTLADLLVIDYGAEWTKASLMKPGMPFDVLLDRGGSGGSSCTASSLC